MTQAPPTARPFPRRTLVRVFCWLVVWSALALFLYVILPCEPRVNFAVPEGKEVLKLSGDLRFAVTGRHINNYFSPVDKYEECSFWNLETGELCAHLSQGEESLAEIEFSPSNRFLIAHDFGEVRLLEPTTGRRWSLEKRRGWAYVGDRRFWLSPDEKTVAIVPKEAPDTVKIIDIDDARVRAILFYGNEGTYVLHGLFSPDSKHFALVKPPGKLRLCDLETGRSHVLASSTKYQDWLWFSPDSRTLAFYSDENEVALWDVPTGTIRAKIPNHHWMSEFSEDGTAMATRGDDAFLIWEVNTGKKRDSLPKVLSAFFMDASGSRFCTSSGQLGYFSEKHRDRRLSKTVTGNAHTLWDLTVQPARPFISFKADAVGFTSDCSLLARWSGSDSIICMDTRTGHELGQIPYDPGRLGYPSNRFSPDNRTFAINQYKPLPNDPFAFYKQLVPKKKARFPSSGERVELWDVPACRRLAVLTERRLREFSDDGKSLAVMNTVENTLEIWDVPPRKPLKKILIGALLLLLYILAVRWLCGRIRCK